MSGIKERQEIFIPDEFNVEVAKSEYVDEYLLEVQPYEVRRFMMGNDRYYFKIDQETGEPSDLCASVTTIKSNAHNGFDLSAWKIDNFRDNIEYKEFMRAKADYGTFVHILCARLAILGSLDLDNIDLELEMYVAEKELTNNRYFNVYEAKIGAKKAVLSFCQFCKDKNVRFLGVEWVLVSKEGYGGAIDYYVELDFNGGRKKAIVDLKTGKRNNEHAIQQWAYYDMVKEHDIDVDLIFTLHPKDYKDGTPKYDLCNHTKNEEAHDDWLDALSTFKRKFKGPSTFMSLKGSAKLDEFDALDNIIFTEPIELMSKKVLDMLDEEDHEPIMDEDISLEDISSSEEEVSHD